MTRNEATRMLVRIKDQINFEWTDSQRKMDALNMAIEALERKRGEWETRWSTYFHADLEYCSVCHNGSALRYKYCPNCGADMRGEDNEQIH